ncbi:hypothetical protein [Streptomyces sp. NPDC002644]
MNQHQPQQPKPGRTALWVTLGVVGVLAVLLLGVTLITVTSGSETQAQPPKRQAEAAAPAYRIVHQDRTGNSREVVVEVASSKRLNDVFAAVADGLTDPAGYFVAINCTTGGTKTVDNRLGNGRVSVGQIGAAATGMDDNSAEFEPNPGRDCPA